MSKLERYFQMDEAKEVEEKDPGQQLTDLLEQLKPVYRKAVLALATEVFRQVRGDIFDEESFQGLMEEKLDGHPWVAWVSKAQLVCLLSENNGSYFDEGIGEGGDADGIEWAALAQYALGTDVREELEQMGLDWEDPAAHLAAWVTDCYQAKIPEAVVLWCALQPRMAEDLSVIVAALDGAPLPPETAQAIDLLEKELDKHFTLNQLHELIEYDREQTDVDRLTCHLEDLVELGPADVPASCAALPREWSLSSTVEGSNDD